MTENRTIEQWTFPIGETVAILTLENTSGNPIEPDDMDALFEAGMLFKKQLIRRSQMRAKPQPDYQI